MIMLHGNVGQLHPAYRCSGHRAHRPRHDISEDQSKKRPERSFSHFILSHLVSVPSISQRNGYTPTDRSGSWMWYVAPVRRHDQPIFYIPNIPILSRHHRISRSTACKTQYTLDVDKIHVPWASAWRIYIHSINIIAIIGHCPAFSTTMCPCVSISHSLSISVCICMCMYVCVCVGFSDSASAVFPFSVNVKQEMDSLFVFILNS